MPETWVYAAAPLTAERLEAALRAGRACIVNDEPSTFRARGDRATDPAWHGIGERVDADREIELRWRGRAELIVDGESMGTHSGGLRWPLPTAAGFHARHLAARGGYSSDIYVNGP